MGGAGGGHRRCDLGRWLEVGQRSGDLRWVTLICRELLLGTRAGGSSSTFSGLRCRMHPCFSHNTVLAIRNSRWVGAALHCMDCAGSGWAG